MLLGCCNVRPPPRRRSDLLCSCRNGTRVSTTCEGRPTITFCQEPWTRARRRRPCATKLESAAVIVTRQNFSGRWHRRRRCRLVDDFGALLSAPPQSDFSGIKQHYLLYSVFQCDQFSSVSVSGMIMGEHVSHGEGEDPRRRRRRHCRRR